MLADHTHSGSWTSNGVMRAGWALLMMQGLSSSKVKQNAVTSSMSII